MTREPSLSLPVECSGTTRYVSVTNGSAGPSLKDDNSEVEVALDFHRSNFSAVVWSCDADEPAVLVKFDRRGKVKSVSVRQDLQRAIKIL